MRRRITWRSAAAVAMLGLAPAGIGAAFAVPAGASTYACAAALGTQCGTFTESAYKAGSIDLTSPNRDRPPGARGGLGWAVKYASSASNTPLIESKNYSPGIDPGTDLTKVEHYGTIPGSPGGRSGYWYSIVYTPSGQWTSMCVSNPYNHGPGGTNLVLRGCNQQKWQAFLAIKPTRGHHSFASPVGDDRLFLPPKPTWWAPTSSVPIPNLSSTFAYALYSMANDRFVEVTRPHMSGAASNPGSDPGFQPRALSATAHSGEPATNTNSWFWTNANGTGPGRGR